MIPADLLILSAVSGGAGFGVMAAAADGGNGVAALAAGGGAGALAVAALVEVTRRLLNGSLVPRATREIEQELGAGIIAAGQREAAVMKVAQDATAGASQIAKDLQARVDRTAEQLADTTRKQSERVTAAMAVLSREVEDLRDEIREMRRGGQQ